MKSVLAAELAILFQFQSVRIILLVLLCVVVSLLALCADKGYFDSCFISHDFGTSHLDFYLTALRSVYLPLKVLCPFAHRTRKKSPFAEVRLLYHEIKDLSRVLVNFFLLYSYMNVEKITCTTYRDYVWNVRLNTGMRLMILRTVGDSEPKSTPRCILERAVWSVHKLRESSLSLRGAYPCSHFSNEV